MMPRCHAVPCSSTRIFTLSGSGRTNSASLAHSLHLDRVTCLLLITRNWLVSIVISVTTLRRLTRLPRCPAGKSVVDCCHLGYCAASSCRTQCRMHEDACKCLQRIAQIFSKVLNGDEA